MATLKAPLLSLDASGKIGDALVFFGWKGIKCVRQHVTPANPNTTDQQTQRTLLSAMVSAWKNYFTGAEARAAWDRLALYMSETMSGFNAFARNVMKVTATDADASFASAMTETANQKVTFTMLNADDGAAGDEAGNFEIWVGDTISGMVLNEQVAIAAGDVVGTNDLGDADDVKYVKLRKGGYDRSGVFKATLIA